MSAAIQASKLGIQALLLDEQPRVGGQIYRNVDAASKAVNQVLGKDYVYGAALTKELRSSDVEVRLGALVWDVSKDLTVTINKDGVTSQVNAAHVIVASGAMERASPIPGWTLPGVMNAGAAQIALKASGAVPSGKVAVIGGGPLLLLVATQLLKSGVEVVGLVETSPSSNQWRAIRHVWGALAAPGYLTKGLGMIRDLRSARVPWFKSATAVRIEGDDQATAVNFCAGGQQRRLDLDIALVHHGVVPNTQISRLLGLAHEWDSRQLAWRVKTDKWGLTSRPGVSVAGDGAAIGGALAAEHAGAIAAIGAAHSQGRVTDDERDKLALQHRRALAKERRIRPFLDTLYFPPNWLLQPADETVVCRCEEVTAGRVREMAELGCEGPNQTKFMSRCGMGPCQGRMCGLAVTQILAKALDKTPQDVGAYRIRAPLKPVSMSSLAGLAPAINSTERPAHPSNQRN
jgi:NADPH-dependent 2,4-dienoyl-CoA reductase/sulfur reductase-like enzyme